MTNLPVARFKQASPSVLGPIASTLMGQMLNDVQTLIYDILTPSPRRLLDFIQ